MPTVNRMLPRVVSVDTQSTTIFGVGREGVMNGGTTLNVLVDGRAQTLNGVPVPAITADITVTIRYRDVRTGKTWPDATVVTVPVAVQTLEFANIGLTSPETGVYEVTMTAVTAAAGAEDVVISSVTTR
jgi:hypothetical protein